MKRNRSPRGNKARSGGGQGTTGGSRDARTVPEETQGHPRFRSAAFILGAAALRQAPEDAGREVAIGGRSNAGKSSALNALTGQSALARVSKTPGRTQQINFFALPGSSGRPAGAIPGVGSGVGSGEASVEGPGEGAREASSDAPQVPVSAAARLVDLPGYGFARAPQKVKLAWSALVEQYLRRRSSLAGLVVIMDCRRPFMDTDSQLVEWAASMAVPCHVVLTKADKLSRGQAARALELARRQLAAVESSADQTAQLFSALRRQGVWELGEVLAGWLWGAGQEKRSAPASSSGERKPGPGAAQPGKPGRSPAQGGGAGESDTIRRGTGTGE